MKNRLLPLALALALCMGLAVPALAAAGGAQNLSDSYEIFKVSEMNKQTWIETVHYGLKDKAGNVVLPAKYSGMYLFGNTIIAAGLGVNHGGVTSYDELPPQYGVIDLQGNILQPFYYEDIVPIDEKGQRLRYDYSTNVYETDGFSGRYFVKKNGLLGVVREDFSVILPPDFYHLEYMDPGYFKCSKTFNNEAHPAEWPNHGATGDCVWALYDMDGKQVFSAQYNRIDDLGDGLFAVKKGGLCGVVNRKNQVVVPLVYQDVTARYKSAFIVTDYRPEYRDKPKDKEPYAVGDLWKHQGIVGVGGKVLMGFDKYQKIKVNAAGRFTCCVWTGGYVVAYYMGTDEYMKPIYGNEYAYEYINYTDLDVTTDVSDLTSPFVDVGFTDYFAEPVKWAVSKGITTGTSGTKFSPEEKCTHIQILTFLYRAVEQIKTPSAADMERAVAWAQEKGMLAPDFNRSKPCTRAEAVYYIWQAMGRQDAPASSFTDVDPNASYAKAVDWAVANGVTKGTDAVKNTFSPDKVCSRGEIVTFLYRAMS